MSSPGEAKARRARRRAMPAADAQSLRQRQPKRGRSVGRLVAAATLACCAVVGVSEAALPRPVELAFIGAGVPLDSIGVVVQEVGKPRPLFEQRGDRPYNPASVMKLVTTFAALELLGPDYRWKTEAYLGGPIEGGVLHGDLILKGGGDPKITIEQWQTFMTNLRAQGLDAVEGNLVLDRSFFAPVAHDPAAFDREPLKPYNVGPDALLVNFKSIRFGFAPAAPGAANVVTVDPPLASVTVGASPTLADGDCGDWRANLAATFIDRGTRADVAFPGRYPASCDVREWWVSLLDPSSYVLGMFDTYFRAAGGRFAGNWKKGTAPADLRAYATLYSPPLWDIVRDVNKLSNNVMARQVFLTLATVNAPPPATTRVATDTVLRWLARRNLKMPELVLDNGSGLSRRERISAGSLARLLIAADTSKVREEFASSLAVAAMDGTVERRFQNGNVAGQAQLKTGTLDGVSALAGYVIDGAGRRFVVVVIVNHPNAARSRGALDNLVQWVYRNAATWTPAKR